MASISSRGIFRLCREEDVMTQRWPWVANEMRIQHTTHWYSTPAEFEANHSRGGHWIHFKGLVWWSGLKDGEIDQTMMWKMWGNHCKKAIYSFWDSVCCMKSAFTQDSIVQKWETSWMIGDFLRLSWYKMGLQASTMHLSCVFIYRLKEWKVMGDTVRVTGYEMGHLLGQVRS